MLRFLVAATSFLESRRAEESMPDVALAKTGRGSCGRNEQPAKPVPLAPELPRHCSGCRLRSARGSYQENATLFFGTSAVGKQRLFLLADLFICSSAHVLICSCEDYHQSR